MRVAMVTTEATIVKAVLTLTITRSKANYF